MTDAEVAVVCTVWVWLLAIAARKSAGACRHHCSRTLSRLEIEAACLSQTSGPVHDMVSVMNHCTRCILDAVLHPIACRHSSSTALWQRKPATLNHLLQVSSKAVRAELIHQPFKTASIKCCTREGKYTYPVSTAVPEQEHSNRCSDKSA